jgi:CDP-paratose 2-epimerase
MTTGYTDSNRVGDHIWWISDNGRFASHYPEWRQAYDVRAIAQELHDRNREHWTA